MLRVRATSHLAHILARVSRGDVVEPQQGAMSLPERKKEKKRKVNTESKFHKVVPHPPIKHCGIPAPKTSDYK